MVSKYFPVAIFQAICLAITFSRLFALIFSGISRSVGLQTRKYWLRAVRSCKWLLKNINMRLICLIFIGHGLNKNIDTSLLSLLSFLLALSLFLSHFFLLFIFFFVFFACFLRFIFFFAAHAII